MSGRLAGRHSLLTWDYRRAQTQCQLRHAALPAREKKGTCAWTWARFCDERRLPRPRAAWLLCQPRDSPQHAPRVLGPRVEGRGIAV
eukprot:44546-Rhodomonas_salina.3